MDPPIPQMDRDCDPSSSECPERGALPRRLRRPSTGRFGESRRRDLGHVAGRAAESKRTAARAESGGAAASARRAEKAGVARHQTDWLRRKGNPAGFLSGASRLSQLLFEAGDPALRRRERLLHDQGGLNEQVGSGRLLQDLAANVCVGFGVFLLDASLLQPVKKIGNKGAFV